jgi:hypothetical protein
MNKPHSADSANTQALAAAALILGFIGVVAWFNGVDFYHRHFFDTGLVDDSRQGFRPTAKIDTLNFGIRPRNPGLVS